ncbi:MAG: hypothetical protein OEW90_15765 [Betaproteobacteria bacterium]|nr:hypothetical protein [Betaproteobacteria bacterium]MDH4325596.1 hypothetical protein [Betaproteobacteria bacterium]
MAKLGDAFSEPERKKSVLRRLVPGAVVYLEVVFPEGRKNKFLVVASVEAECCTFVINSRVHPFVEARAELAVCQVKLDAARHEFLRRDSWIACHAVLTLRTDAVIADLAADMTRFKGIVQRDVLDEIAAAVKRAPTLSTAEQARLVESLLREGD